MSSTTPNIGLTKTTAAETIGQNWAASNDSGGNFDIIDTKMGAVGNTSLQAQVTALNSKITPQAIAITYGNVVTSAGQGLTVRKSANVITVNGYVRLASAITTQTLLATLPEGARPGDAVRTNAIMCTNPYEPGENAYLLIGTGGNLEIVPSASNTKTSAYFSCAFVAQG